MTKAKISPREAIKFLERFDHETYTVAAIPEPNAGKKGFDLPHFKSTKYAENGKPKLAHSFKLEEFDKELVTELAQLQKIKRAIYILVNEGDGITTEHNVNATRKENIMQLSACFCDTDNCPPQKVFKWIKSKGVSPHIVIETSPKRYHMYFLLEPTSLDDDDKWKAIQKCMGWLGDRDVDHGMDKSMHDITQLMRLPGFLHQKGNPFQSHIVKQNWHDPYTIDYLFNAFDCEQFYIPNRSTKKYEYPEGHIAEGERHEVFRNYALHTANRLVGDDKIYEKTLDAVDGFILKKFKKPYSFLIGGKRRHEVLRTVKDAVNLASEALIESLPVIDFDPEQEKKDKFSLSDLFYESAPGIVGEIVKEINRNARYPIPAFAFASTVSMIGTLKSPYLTSDEGHAPSSYFMCLAPSGAGKNYAQEVLTHTLYNLSVPDLAAGKVRSARGIEQFLVTHDSIGLLQLDEAEGLFTSFNNENTPIHLRQTKDLLLDLYSKTNAPYFHTGYVGDEKRKGVVLKYPRLNLICYGVIHTLEKAFTKKAIADGLLQRFIVLTHMEGRERNKNSKPAVALNGHIESALREMINLAKIGSLADSAELEKWQRDYEAVEDEKKKKKILAKIQELQNKQQDAERQVIRFDVDALDLLDKFSDKLDGLATAELAEGEGFEGLYTRGAEQVGRLATAICQDKTISKGVVQYCIDLVESRVLAMRDYTGSNLGLVKHAKYRDKAFERICKEYKETKAPVTYRRLYSKLMSSTSRTALREILDDLYAAGMLHMITPPSTGGRGKKGESFVPTSVLEREDI